MFYLFLPENKKPPNGAGIPSFRLARGKGPETYASSLAEGEVCFGGCLGWWQRLLALEALGKPVPFGWNLRSHSSSLLLCMISSRLRPWFFSCQPQIHFHDPEPNFIQKDPRAIIVQSLLLVGTRKLLFSGVHTSGLLLQGSKGLLKYFLCQLLSPSLESGLSYRRFLSKVVSSVCMGGTIQAQTHCFWGGILPKTASKVPEV